MDGHGMDAPPEALLKEAEAEWSSVSAWFCAEEGLLLRSLLHSAAVIAAGALICFAGKLLAGRLSSGPHPRRGEWCRTLLPPLAAALTLSGVFFAFLPLLRTLPRCWYTGALRGFYTLMTVFLAWSVCRIISSFDRRLRLIAERSDNNLDNLTVGMIGSSLKIAVGMTAFLFIGQNIFDFNITALLASAGVIGLSLALAAKDTVSNFFGTLVIIADAPFRIGDRIESDRVKGIVLSVGMRSSRILLEDGSVCAIPNSALTNSPLLRVNPRGMFKHVFTLSLTYDSAVRRAEEVLREIWKGFPGPDDPEFAPRICFSSFGEFALNIRVIVWFRASGYQEAEELIDAMNLAILERFRKEKLDFAYPTRTLLLENAG